MVVPNLLKALWQGPTREPLIISAAGWAVVSRIAPLPLWFGRTLVVLGTVMAFITYCVVVFRAHRPL